MSELSKRRIPCKVFAPATVANVAVGYDILGFAIDGIGDEVVIRKGSVPGLVINKITYNSKKGLSKDINKNVAGFAGLKLLESLGLEKEPIEIDLIKNMPIGTGLGSSASSAVAGAFAINEYLNMPYSKKELLPFVTEAEKLADGSYHADNVAPCLLGGMVLIRDNATLDVIKIPTIPAIKAVVIYPHVKILTKDSRSILSPNITLRQHVAQSGNLGAFIAAMYHSDIKLLRRSLEDQIIEPQRAELIPHFDMIKEIALEEDAFGFSISGAGPSMFGLCANTMVAENIEKRVKAYYKKQKINCTVYISDINKEGAIRY